MDTWTVLIPVLVLVAFLAYRLVGCTPFTSSQETAMQTHDYAGLVDTSPGIVAHWRLGDASGNVAVDRIQPASPAPPLPNGLRPGTYKAVASPGIPADDPQGATAPGTFDLNQGSLLAGDAASKSANFNGGYVDVPFAPQLNPPQFTIEAWVNPSWAPETPPKFYSVITSRQDDGAKRGYILYAGPPLPPIPAGKDANKTYWQFWVGIGDPVNWIQLVGPEVALKKTAHLVASCDGLQLKLWVDGGKEEGGVHLPSEQRTSPTAYVPNQARPLFIAGGKTDKNPPDSPRYPFIGRIQDVAVYNVANIDVKVHVAKGSDLQP